MITKLDEALSICVVLGTLTHKQASNISAVCEQSLGDCQASGVKADFVLHLKEVIEAPGTIFVFKSDILELISPNPGKETIQ